MFELLGSTLFYYALVTLPVLFYCGTSTDAKKGERQPTAVEAKVFGWVVPLLAPGALALLLTGIVYLVTHAVLNAGEADSVTMGGGLIATVMSALIVCGVSDALLRRRLGDVSAPSKSLSGLTKLGCGMLLLSILLLFVGILKSATEVHAYTATANTRSRRTGAVIYNFHSEPYNWGLAEYLIFGSLGLAVGGIGLTLFGESREKS